MHDDIFLSWFFTLKMLFLLRINSREQKHCYRVYFLQGRWWWWNMYNIKLHVVSSRVGFQSWTVKSKNPWECNWITAITNRKSHKWKVCLILVEKEQKKIAKTLSLLLVTVHMVFCLNFIHFLSLSGCTFTQTLMLLLITL